MAFNGVYVLYALSGVMSARERRLALARQEPVRQLSEPVDD